METNTTSKKISGSTKRLKQVVLFSIFNSAFLVVSAQDIHFSQFYMSPLTQNPAMAGANYDIQALINYKEQWKSVATPYKTFAASCDARINKKRSKKGYLAAGLNFFNDKAGDGKMGITQVNLNVAYHVRLNGYNTLGGGLQAGFVQRSIDYSALQWGDQYDGNFYNSALPSGETQSSTSFVYPDLGGGIVWCYNNTSGAKEVDDNHDFKTNLGVAVFHPHQPKYSFNNGNEKLFAKIVVHGSALISVPGTNVAVVPGFMYYNQGPAQEIYVGSLIRYKLKQESKYTGINKGVAFSLGAFTRAKDALVAAFLLEYSNYAMGVSYDINTSGLTAVSTGRGGFEISLRYVTPNPFLYKSKARF